jgi:hypothetical protein
MLEVMTGNPLTHSKNIVWRIIDGEALLLNFSTGSHYMLNPVASLIWTGLTEGKTHAEIITSVQVLYEVDTPTLEADIQDLIKQLQEENILTDELESQAGTT